MQVVVISDNHGKITALEEIKNKYQSSILIHCGDSELPPEYLKGFVAVQGNNDLFYDYPDLKIISIESVRIMIVHGHAFLATTRIAQLVEKAKRHGCKVVCYGHTHIYHTELVDGIWLVNPGSLWRNRDFTSPSYAVMEIQENNITVERKNYL